MTKTPISLQMNADMTAVTQNVVDLMDSIGAHYLVNHKSDSQGGGFGFNFGHYPICEHSIRTGYKEPNAKLRLHVNDNQFITSILGMSPQNIIGEVNRIRKDSGNELANNHHKTFNSILDARFGKGIVTTCPNLDRFSFIINITSLTTEVISAVSEILQHTDMDIRVNPLRLHNL